jgi:hypothetical protein
MKKTDICPTCGEETEKAICISCSGSGEGQHDETKCSECCGSGEDDSLDYCLLCEVFVNGY